MSMQNRPTPLGADYAPRMEEWDEKRRQEFGERLKAGRLAKGMTLDDVGAMFEVLKQTVSSWEKGRNMPNAEVVARLAAEFEMPCEWILLGVRAEPFSLALRARLLELPPDDLRRIENGIRGQLEMPPLPKAVERPERTKRSGTLG